jgi:hypothetical protein
MSSRNSDLISTRYFQMRESTVAASTESKSFATVVQSHHCRLDVDEAGDGGPAAIREIVFFSQTDASQKLLSSGFLTCESIQLKDAQHAIRMRMEWPSIPDREIQHPYRYGSVRTLIYAFGKGSRVMATRITHLNFGGLRNRIFSCTVHEFSLISARMGLKCLRGTE